MVDPALVMVAYMVGFSAVLGLIGAWYGFRDRMKD